MAESQNKALANPQQTFDDIAAQYESSIGQITRPIAQHLATLSLGQGVDANGIILDNACGTGIVLDELLQHLTSSALERLSITAVDAAPQMIGIVKNKMQRNWIKPEGGVQADRFRAMALPAEQLDALESDYFTHSFTNFGFQFFRDAAKAAADVYRTLKPGGYAYVTAWADVGYVSGLNVASEEVRPGKPSLKLPWADEWYQASHLKEVMSKAGFQDVEMHTWDSAWPGSSKIDIANSMCTFLTQLVKGQGWSEEEAAKLPKALERAFEAYPKEALFQEDGQWKIKMVANVAVCKK